MNGKYDFSVEQKFTETYKKYRNEPAAIREAMCLQQMYPYILGDIEEGDTFAGRTLVSYGRQLSGL